jgi:hypothetical protein
MVRSRFIFSQEGFLMRLASLLTLTAALSFAAPSPAGAQTDQPEDAGAAYERQAIGVRHLVVPRRDGATSDGEGHLLYDGKWDAFAGRDHHPIDEEAFFRIVGRDDLLRRYRREATVKKSLTFGGGALVFGGLLFAAVTAELRYGGAQPAIGCEGTGCLSADSRAPSPVWGLAIAGTGLVSTIIGRLLDPTPIDAAQADALARCYDRSVQSQLGIAETSARE